jgi:hypothetical protein
VIDAGESNRRGRSKVDRREARKRVVTWRLNSMDWLNAVFELDIWQYYVDVTLILNLALGYADGGEFTQV